MAAITDYSRPTTPDSSRFNVNASPRTAKPAGLALTEYSANPSPPRESTQTPPNLGIPDAFLLPSGYPDVRHSHFDVDAKEFGRAEPSDSTFASF